MSQMKISPATIKTFALAFLRAALVMLSPKALIATHSKKLSIYEIISFISALRKPENKSATKNHSAKYGKSALRLDFSPIKK